MADFAESAAQADTRSVELLFCMKSNQIKFICHKFSRPTQYNNEFALRLAGQTGDNFALMSAHDN